MRVLPPTSKISITDTKGARSASGSTIMTNLFVSAGEMCRLNLSPALLHVYNPSGAGVGLGDRLPRTGAAVLEKDSWSAAIVDELAPPPADIRVDKYRMSGFWDTPLDSILRNLGVTTLLFGGVNADQCVLHTLADGNFLGYDTLMIEDCTATTSPAYCWEATLYNVRQIFGFTVSSQSLLA